MSDNKIEAAEESWHIQYEGLTPRALHLGEMRKYFTRNEFVHAQ